MGSSYFSKHTTATTSTLDQLSRMNKHYVVATKKYGYKEEWKPYIENWAKALLILQSQPDIMDPYWKQRNPYMRNNYMDQSIMIYNTEELKRELKRIHDETMEKCPGVNEYIIRSNDGIHAEDPEEEKWI